MGKRGNGHSAIDKIQAIGNTIFFELDGKIIKHRFNGKIIKIGFHFDRLTLQTDDRLYVLSNNGKKWLKFVENVLCFHETEG